MKHGGAHEEHSVAALYQDADVAETYIQRRFSHAWSRMLHQKQVAAVQGVLQTWHPADIVELAPGPARIASELGVVQHGIMLDRSAEMLALARQRLTRAGLETCWDIRQGNAFDLKELYARCDFLYSFRFIRHFQHADRMRLYREIAACLRPQGLFMLDVVNRTVRQRLDAKQPAVPQGELSVYDETYSPESLRQEMVAHGFEVLQMTPVVSHFTLQSWISYRLDRRWEALAHWIVQALEHVPSAQPLEWVALCRKLGERT